MSAVTERETTEGAGDTVGHRDERTPAVIPRSLWPSVSSVPPVVHSQIRVVA